MSSLLRSTKFVRYFAGAARTLILNSAKTAEANLLINSKALCVSNNVMTRDYATSKKTESLEPLLQRLDSEVRRFGRISKRDIDEVYDELRGKDDITSSQSLLVIRCCGELVPEELPEQRTLLVQKIWSVLTERGVPMDISHYNALLRVYIENEHPFSPAEFLNELEKKGLQPNRVTYQRLMWRYCQEGDVEGATKVLEKMRELGFPVSEPVLNALVMGHAFHGDTDGAKAVLETMAGAGLQPSNRTYALLACGFAKKGDLEGVERVLKDASDKDAFVTDKDILDVMESLALGGHGDKIESLFAHLQKGPGFVPDLCNLIIKLINKGQEALATNLMKTMPNKPDNDNTLYKGAFFVKQLLKVQKSPEVVVQTCRELQRDNVVPNALYIATEGALQQANSALALLLFKELEKDGLEIRQHYYWPLLAKKGKENDEEGLLQLIRDMNSAGLTPTGECLRDYVIPYLSKRDTPQNVLLKLQVATVPRILGARNVMVDLLESGKIKDAANVALEYRPFGQFSLVGRPLVNSLAKTKDVKSFVTVLHVISSKVPQNEEDASHDETQSEDKSDAHNTGRIVLSALKVIDKSLYEELLNEVLAKGLQISTASAEAIEAYLGQNLTGSISERLAQLTSPELEIAPIELYRRTGAAPARNSAQLEKLLAQAKGKDSNNVTRLQKQLLILYVQENNLEKVEAFLKELEAVNFELSNASLAMLCEFYAQNGDIDKALSYKQTLETKEPVFLLNRFKLVQIASAFIRADRFDEAVKFLREAKPDSHEGATFSLNARCWQVLNNLAEAKDAEKVQELTKVLIDMGYMEATNILLGPSIKVHLLRNDVEGALQQFEQCCKQYRATPWKGELMKALILKEDAGKLQWLADLSTQIHGEVNILHDLVLAFVECGRLRQARRILETPGMQTRQKRLQDACERYVQEGKSEYLEGLLEATKELSYIDRAKIFYHLLVTYCKADQTDKALGLWTILQEEGEIPSEDFLTTLGTHLKAKNQNVPFAYVSKEAPKPKTKSDVKPKRSPPTLTKKDATEKIEALVREGKLAAAMDTVLKSLSEGVVPKANAIKYLLRNLAGEGNVEAIEKLGKLITPTTKRDVTYDDKLTLAVFVKGDGPKHVEELSRKVQSAKSEAELAEALVKFPRSNALATVVNSDELIGKCHKVAEIAASKGQVLPANLLWMEYVLAGKDQEADQLWDNHLKNAETIAYRRLLQECHTRNQPQLAEKLISSLKTNSYFSTAILGNVYSRLINLHLTNSNNEDARLTLEKALADGCKLENLTKVTLKRLKEAMETVGQEFKYTIP